MVRSVLAEFLAVTLLLTSGVLAQSQEPTPGVQGQQEDQYFSGTVTAMDSGKITVIRTVLGTESTTKTFALTSATRYEGKPKVKSRVTVKFVSGDEGERAVHIVVRPNSSKK
jgi:hypothetical protein